MTACAKRRETNDCDLFCRVVDNFGDVGLCWRLARQLVREHGMAVRLWIDDLESFQHLCPEVVLGVPAQRVRGVEVRRWIEPIEETPPARLVIEAFGCGLPERFLHAMANRDPAPRWIHLEHLTAEDWAIGCHRLPSHHPRLPVRAIFFFPGFVPGTGGVARESDLAVCRDAFCTDARAVAAFWNRLGLPAASDRLNVSLFCYPDAPAANLLEAWAASRTAVRCLVPEIPGTRRLAAHLGADPRTPGPLRRGNLEVWPIPFLDQDQYDRLLWACDANFVRGEDSFVRAQWALRPFVWQAYPQSGSAHHAKVAAFLDRYCDGLEPAAAKALRELWSGWNGMNAPAAGVWEAFVRHRAVLTAHAVGWARRLEALGDLAGNLVRCRDQSL